MYEITKYNLRIRHKCHYCSWCLLKQVSRIKNAKKEPKDSTTLNQACNHVGIDEKPKCYIRYIHQKVISESSKKNFKKIFGLGLDANTKE